MGMIDIVEASSTSSFSALDRQMGGEMLLPAV